MFKEMNAINEKGVIARLRDILISSLFVFEMFIDVCFHYKSQTCRYLSMC